jgi:hypothetical protein
VLNAAVDPDLHQCRRTSMIAATAGALVSAG